MPVPLLGAGLVLEALGLAVRLRPHQDHCRNREQDDGGQQVDCYARGRGPGHGGHHRGHEGDIAGEDQGSVAAAQTAAGLGQAEDEHGQPAYHEATSDTFDVTGPMPNPANLFRPDGRLDKLVQVRPSSDDVLDKLGFDAGSNLSKQPSCQSALSRKQYEMRRTDGSQMIAPPGPSSHARQGGRTKESDLDPKTPVSSTEHDPNSSGGLLDYEAAAHYLCTTPRHVRELWAKRHVAAVKVGRRVSVH